MNAQIVQGAHYRFTVLTPALIRMEYSETDNFTEGKTQVVVNRDFPEASFHVKHFDEQLEIVTSQLRLNYDGKPFSAGGLSVQLFQDRSRTWHFGDRLDTLKGTARTLDGADGAIPLGDGIISRVGYSVLDDSKSLLVTTGADGLLNFTQREAGSADLYFFGYHHHYRQALQDYYRLTGPTPLIPRYALGNWWSRYYQYTQDSFLKLLDTFAQHHVPLSVAILDMDWHLVDIPHEYGRGWTGYTWNHEFFPEPAQLLQKVHERGLKIALNVHPASGIRAYEAQYAKIAKRLGLDQKAKQPADFDMTNHQFVQGYFQDVHDPLEAQGVDFWWIDWQQGQASKIPNLDPLWLLNYYHFQESKRKTGGQGLILSRYAGPGSHRYPIGFSGDSIISWRSLQFQPYFTATAANIGYGWWSNDIGGHMRGKYDEELFLRWVQLGVFSPINRLHGSNSAFINKEPWLCSEPYASTIMQTLRQRHRFLPYLYTMNVRAAEKGVPLVLPMYYLDAEDPAAYQVPNQYLFGNQVMVAPITTPIDARLKLAKEQVWLPKGTWFDLASGWQYRGDTTLTIYRKLDQIPVFAKAGAILPLADQADETFGTALPQTVFWHVFPGASNQFTLVEDAKGKRLQSTLTVNWAKQQAKLTAAGDEAVAPAGRKHVLVLHGAGTSATTVLSLQAGETVNLKQPQGEFDLHQAAFERLRCAWVETEEKEQALAAVQNSADFAHLVNQLRAGAAPELFGMLYELGYVQASAARRP